MPTLALDFGTSNSAAAVMAGDRPFAIPLEPGQETLPSAVFLDFTTRRTLYGSPAAAAMRAGEEGRFLRALKSVLGTPLAQEPRMFMNERLTLIEVIARFLEDLRKRAEAFTGQRYTEVLSGRPVRFHTRSEALDAQAQADLEAAYRLAGFSGVRFLPEPEAAALAVQGHGRMLIVDIGGGTSDFTLCERHGDQTRILASGGRRIGGTDFDKALSLVTAMPLLGYGAEIGAELGTGTHTAPRALFQDLASWEKIPFVYDAARLREVRRWVRLAPQPQLFERLAEVLEMHLGHDIAYAVEAGKIAANSGDGARVALDVVSSGLSAPLPRALLIATLDHFAEEIATGARETVQAAGCSTEEVDSVVFVGGSSLMGVVREAIGRAFPGAAQTDSAVFTAVVHGLARAAG